jgi:hypothetical protein
MANDGRETGPWHEESTEDDDPNPFQHGKTPVERQHDSIMLLQQLVQAVKDLCIRNGWQQTTSTFEKVDKLITLFNPVYQHSTPTKQQDIIIQLYNKLMLDLRPLYSGRKEKNLRHLLETIKLLSEDIHLEILDLGKCLVYCHEFKIYLTEVWSCQ